MTVRKRPDSPYWHFDFWYRGRRYKGSTKQTAKVRAQEYEVRVRYQVEHGEDPFARSPLIAELLTRYGGWLEVNRSAVHAERSRRAIDNVLRRMRRVKTAEDITTSRVEDFKKRRLGEASPFTVNLESRCLKAFLRRCVKMGWLRAVPCEIEQVRTPSRGRLVFLSESEIGPFLEKLKPWAREAAGLILRTGLRLDEARFLQWTDIDLEAGELWVRNKPDLGFAPKSRKDRAVALPPDLAEELVSRRTRKGWVLRGAKGGQMDKRTLQRAVSEAGEKAGLDKRITCHTLRHSYGSHLAMSGVDIETIRGLMGHSTIITTSIYLHTDAEHRRKAVAKLRLPGMGKGTEKLIRFPTRGEGSK